MMHKTYTSKSRGGKSKPPHTIGAPKSKGKKVTGPTSESYLGKSSDPRAMYDDPQFSKPSKDPRKDTRIKAKVMRTPGMK